MTKPLLVELYCRFLCQGSEKLGSECMQNTCTGIAVTAHDSASALIWLLNETADIRPGKDLEKHP